MKRILTALLAGGATTAVVVGVAVVTHTHTDGAGARRDEQTTSLQAEPPAAPALDDVPGLGSSKAGLERDEVISYWEAWERDTLIAECVDKAGFVWHPEALYPDDEVVAVAITLGVPVGDPPDPPPTPPEDANRAIEGSLDSTRGTPIYSR